MYARLCEICNSNNARYICPGCGTRVCESCYTEVEAVCKGSLCNTLKNIINQSNSRQRLSDESEFLGFVFCKSQKPSDAIIIPIQPYTVMDVKKWLTQNLQNKTATISPMINRGKMKIVSSAMATQLNGEVERHEDGLWFIGEWVEAEEYFTKAKGA